MAAAPMAAHAQQAQKPAEEPIVLEDVVVTASKYSATVQTTPIAVTAISGAGLEKAGVSDVGKLSTQAPSIQIGSNGANSSIDISMRGVASNNVDTYSGSPAVSVHVDGVYVARATGLNATFYDIDRVEVLRGPQGTLYGRNATAGNVNIITTKPKQEFDAKADIAYGNYDSVTAHAMVNLPLTDTLALRATVSVNRNDGYIDTLGTTTDNYFKAEQSAARVALRWTPSEKLTWDVHVEGYRDTGTPNLGIAIPVAGSNISFSDGYGVYKRPVTPPSGFVDMNILNVRSTLEYQFSDNLSLAYIAGYGRQHTRTFTDDEGYAFKGADVDFIDRQWSLSHEVDLRWSSDRIKAVAGANYFHEKDRGDLAVNLYMNRPPAPPSLHFGHPDFSQNAVGLFGQTTWSVSDKLRVTGGIRYSQDKAKSPGDSIFFCPIGTPVFSPASACFGSRSQGTLPRKWTGWSYRGGVDYDLTDTTMLYGSVSTGYKQGKLSQGSFPVVRPEKVTNYELGVKNRLFDRTVTLNAAVFYMDYADLQVQQVVFTGPGVTNNITTNAAKARIYGAEIESTWQITADDNLTGFITLLDAKYDKYANVIDSVVDFTNSNPLDLSGNRLIRSPKFSARVGYNHVFHLENGATLTPWVSYYYQTETYLRAFNTPQDRQKGYSRTDLRLTYVTGSGKISLEGFVNNLENEAVKTAEYEVTGTLLGYYAPPRLYGLKLAWKY